MAVEISGWRDYLPNAGDTLLQIGSEARLKQVAQFRKKREMDAMAEKDKVLYLDYC